MIANDESSKKELLQQLLDEALSSNIAKLSRAQKRS